VDVAVLDDAEAVEGRGEAREGDLDAWAAGARLRARAPALTRRADTPTWAGKRFREGRASK
jgi:hypothetical protein